MSNKYISAINYDLADNYGLERDEDGEVRHILFLDEADQICTNNFDPPRIASSQLTFLKECMGSDNKEIEEFDGKFTKPQKPKIEEVVEESVKSAANKISNDIAKVIDIRLQELKTVANETRLEIETGQALIAQAISQGIEELTSLLAEKKT